jgi:lipoprotein-anchoring transpeptidase ErfK/SrfK
MEMRVPKFLFLGLLVLGFAMGGLGAGEAATAKGKAQSAAPKAEEINSASQSSGSERAKAAKLQILLDRAEFSPGSIDGRMGENVKNALAAFKHANGLKADEESWSKLTASFSDPAIVEYTIAEEDVKAPFAEKIPNKLEEQAELERLGYTGPSELLAEKFHMDEEFLKALNPGKDLSKAGTVIQVANVKREKADAASVQKIEVDKPKKQLRALGQDGKVLAVFPATVGSQSRPAPKGEHEVTAVAKNPNYTYNPKYKFEGVKTDKPFTIKPGPNNPVGSVWIDLSEEGYGIHGTPEPDAIGKTASHGCVRLTNWDAEMLAGMVKKGVKVAFIGT